MYRVCVPGLLDLNPDTARYYVVSVYNSQSQLTFQQSYPLNEACVTDPLTSDQLGVIEIEIYKGGTDESLLHRVVTLGECSSYGTNPSNDTKWYVVKSPAFNIISSTKGYFYIDYASMILYSAYDEVSLMYDIYSDISGSGVSVVFTSLVKLSFAVDKGGDTRVAPVDYVTLSATSGTDVLAEFYRFLQEIADVTDLEDYNELPFIIWTAGYLNADAVINLKYGAETTSRVFSTPLTLGVNTVQLVDDEPIPFPHELLTGGKGTSLTTISLGLTAFSSTLLGMEVEK